MSSITKTATGRGEVRYRVRYRDPAGASREKWHAKKAAAERFAAGVKADIDRGDFIDPNAGKITLAEWMSTYEVTRVGRRPSTIVRDECIIRNHVLPAFGHRSLKSIQPVEVRAWVVYLTANGRSPANGLSPATVRMAHQLLSGALEAAYQDGLIRANPARRVEMPALGRTEMRFLNLDEINALADTIGGRYRCLVLAAAYTGLRIGELLALKVSRLDMLRRTLRVEETLTDVAGHLAFGPPKTAAARRTVTLPKALVEETAAHLAAYPAGPGGVVFTGANGGLIAATNFRNRHWIPAVRASVGEPCRIHDMRHSHVALLIAKGVHPKVIQARLGHASIRTTLDRYGHLFPGFDEAAADALDQKLSERAVGLAWG